MEAPNRATTNTALAAAYATLDAKFLHISRNGKQVAFHFEFPSHTEADVEKITQDFLNDELIGKLATYNVKLKQFFDMTRS